MENVHLIILSFCEQAEFSWFCERVVFCLPADLGRIVGSFIHSLLGRAKQAKGERVSERQSHEGLRKWELATIYHKLSFVLTKGNTIGWKMTFQKSKLIKNRPSWPALNFCGSLNSPQKEDRQRKKIAFCFWPLWEITVVCESNLVLRGIILITVE